jgi:hypothetical protein
MTRFARQMRDRFAAAAIENGWTVNVREHLLQATKQGNTLNLSIGEFGQFTSVKFAGQDLPTGAAAGLVPLLFDMKEA